MQNGDKHHKTKKDLVTNALAILVALLFLSIGVAIGLFGSRSTSDKSGKVDVSVPKAPPATVE